ncbi:hypothetical protein DPMN_024869 [Dreissena polymorpha]|uniref:Uncharacterized protein n=1 Tax=Dreissena polymorpha TaxID=45954 RepID=A0A9D4RD26_DREPO|nr:hypothetical protein DPMN_024869 [Dreissena polymorpha]
MVAERGYDPRTSGLWAQHASTAPWERYSLVRTDEPTDRLTWERYGLNRTAGPMSQLTDSHGKGTALTGMQDR